jgi:2-keto-3-deoxy-L-rhamnonate aldolase RhmA
MTTKSKLRAGEAALGGWIMIPHPSVAEIMAGEGFDWIAIDLEHTSANVRDVHDMALALKGTGVDLLVRLPCGDATLAKLVLDTGAGGIIVPAVNTPEKAAQAVAMAKFPPEGSRGVSLCRATDFGRNFANYFKSHNEDVTVAIMIEDYIGACDANAILETPGLDAVFIGPYDLSTSMGLAGQCQHPEVLAAQAKVLAACQRHGVAPGIHVVTPDQEELKRRLAEGFRFIACGIDTLFVQQGCRTMLRHLQTDLPPHRNGKSMLPSRGSV